jgi:hypothetical protein
MAIFDFAYWIEEDDKRATGWLAAAARTCRAFAKPALETLYKEPRFSSSRQIDVFTTTLDAFHRRPESRYMDYLPKIKSLSLDECMLLRSFDIVALINILPALVDVDIWSSKDRGHNPYQRGTEVYMQYRPEQWEKIDPSHRPLRSWRWNTKMGRLDEMRSIHKGLPIFSRIRRLTMTNLDLASVRGASRVASVTTTQSEDIDQQGDVFAAPTVKDYRFEFCDALAGNFVAAGINLRTLEIHSCDNVDSPSLAGCLAAAGAQLHTLVLDHNRSLNLEFLQILGASCPRLATLSMNLLYFEHQIDGTTPNYLVLMEPGHVPNWPPLLESLSLHRLRNWTVDDAAALFSSIEREPFPRLRSLVLTASVDLPWHQRATFRDEWCARFDRAFKRPPPAPPSRHLVSLKAFRLWKAAYAKKAASEEARGREPGALADSLSSRVKSAPGTGTTRTRAAAAAQAEAEDEVELPTGREHPQGLCDVVDVRIDNGRPRDHEFRESDMLDSEESGDSDFSDE